ncbi:hypothetical protein [Haloarcula sp. CGMCC 1.6347]|uniref:hypothetical protein n=1 Tax=Haloarcula sp. CGMCC 1.6347 TaxID=3111455 RepID=UPI00300F6474
MEYSFYIGLILTTTVLTCLFAAREEFFRAGVAGCTTLAFARAAQLAGAGLAYWHDSHYYLASARAVAITGHLDRPQSLQWIELKGYFGWPDIQILATTIHEITTISMHTLRYVIPILFVCLTFLFLWFTYGQFAGWGAGCIASLGTLMLDPFFRYFVQFHGQSIGVTFGSLFLGTVIFVTLRQQMSPTTYFRYLILFSVVSLGFLFSHRFSILIIGVALLGSYVTGDILTQLSERILEDSRGGYYIPGAALPAALLFGVYVIYRGEEFFVWGIAQLTQVTDVGGSGPTQTTGRSWIDYPPLVLKALVPALSLIGVWAIIKDRLTARPWLTLACTFGAITIPFTIANPRGVSRIILFVYIFIGGLCSVSVAVALDSQREWVEWGIPAIITLIVLLGTLGGSVPGLVDHSTNLGNDPFQNTPPIQSQAPAAGEFIDEYKIERIEAGFWGRVVATRYGKVPIPVVDGVRYNNVPYFVYDSARETPPDGSLVYTNGRIEIVRRSGNNV